MATDPTNSPTVPGLFEMPVGSYHYNSPYEWAKQPEANTAKCIRWHFVGSAPSEAEPHTALNWFIGPEPLPIDLEAPVEWPKFSAKDGRLWVYTP